MEPKLSEVPLQPLMKSSEAEDEKAVAHDQVELREASQGNQEQNKGQHWLKRCLSQKGKSVFIAVTTMLGYILLLSCNFSDCTLLSHLGESQHKL